MQRLFFCLGSLILVISSTNPCAAQPQEIDLWPGKAPGETMELGAERAIPGRKGEGKPIIRLTDVSKPILTIYRPESPSPKGTAVIVCPGGGYNILAYNHEGTEICEWLNSIGVTAVLLKYRVPRRDRENPHLVPLKDALRAVRVVRGMSEKLNINPERIGMLGFSAGGNLTVMAGTHYDDKAYEPADAVDSISARPDFLIPIYPAYLLDPKQKDRLDPRIPVTEKTPPTFMAITYDDADRAIGTSLLFVALKQNKVPAELHIYHKGGHGYGMRPSENPVSQWPTRCHEWMIALGLLDPVKSDQH